MAKSHDVIPSERKSGNENSEKSTEVGACPSKVCVTMSPPTALCLESQAGGVHVGGQLLWQMHGMCGTVDAEFVVQRTILRAGLTAFPCLLRRMVVPAQLMWLTRQSLLGFGQEKGVCGFEKCSSASLCVGGIARL